MNNNLTDLNNHLFEQIKRLGKQDITQQELNHEVIRAKAISTISNDIVDNAKVCLDAMKLQLDFKAKNSDLPAMLQNKNNND